MVLFYDVDHFPQRYNENEQIIVVFEICGLVIFMMIIFVIICKKIYDLNLNKDKVNVKQAHSLYEDTPDFTPHLMGSNFPVSQINGDYGNYLGGIEPYHHNEPYHNHHPNHYGYHAEVSSNADFQSFDSGTSGCGTSDCGGGSSGDCGGSSD